MGSYKTPDGKTVSFTDSQAVELATDLYQFIEHDYKGSPSVDATRLESILKNLQAGKPLQAQEWDILSDLRRRMGSEFDGWRQQGREGQSATVPDGTGRISEAQSALRPSELSEIRESYETKSTTPQDRATTPPHLHDGALHDLAHAMQHGERLSDSDVRGSKKSLDFNVEHLMKHLASGIDHLSRLGKHLEKNPSDPKVWSQEKTALHKLRESSPHPPPNLRMSEPHDEATENVQKDPVKECGTCTMFNCGRCWGYGNIRVDDDWVCDSWDPDPNWRQQNAQADQLDLVRLAEAGKYEPPDVATKTGLPVSAGEIHNPVICVDFDGVLHQGPHGLPGAVGGDVVDGAPESLAAIRKMGYHIVVLTARVDLKAVRDWLTANQLDQYIDEVTNRKPPASAYIDDRATHFTDWPTAVQAVDPLTVVSEKPKLRGRLKESALELAQRAGII